MKAQVETVEEFLARGGQVNRCKAGSKTTTMTNREVIKKDAQLKELRKLKKSLKKQSDIDAVDNAISIRIDILK